MKRISFRDVLVFLVEKRFIEQNRFDWKNRKFPFFHVFPKMEQRKIKRKISTQKKIININLDIQKQYILHISQYFPSQTLYISNPYTIFLIIQGMNKNTKLLPQLNQLFLQKQSYASHKKKILQIRNKKPKPTIREQLYTLHSRRSSKQISLKDSKITTTNNNNNNSNNIRTPKAQLSQIPPIIMERCQSLGNSFDWMNPYRRNRHLTELRENQRIRSRIDSSKSDLRRNKLEKEMDKFQKIKKRLMKFEVNPQSHKTMLKSQKSLHFVQSPKHSIKSPSKLLDKLPQNRKTSLMTNFLTQHQHQHQRQQRKQSNFSMFVKRTCQMKKQSVTNITTRRQMESRLRPVINYAKVEKNLAKYERKDHERRLKTQLSKLSNNNRNSNSKMSKIGATNSTYRYFHLTEPDE